MNFDGRFREIERGGEHAEHEELLNAVVRLAVPEDEGGGVDWARQTTAICLADLLARFLPRLQIDCPSSVRADPDLPPGLGGLCERLIQARDHSLLSPQPVAQEETPVLTVVVGGSGDGDLYVEGSGWISYLGSTRPGPLPSGGRNPIGPLIAACRGASQVLQRVFAGALRETAIVESSHWSALTLAPWAPGEGPGPELDEPRVDALLMGAGSIGGASAYALARVPELAGNLPVVDFDALEEPNSRKALLARKADIAAEARKIDVAKAELDHLADLDVTPFFGRLAEWVASKPADQPLPTVLCAVDSMPARRELADHMPLEVVNAACGATDISVSGHRTDEGPCVYCLYIGEVLDEAKTKTRIIARELGLVDGLVAELRAQQAPLNEQHLTAIERARSLPRGSLGEFFGRTIDELFAERVLYGEVRIEDSEGRGSALQLAFVPALAGFILASEALKRGHSDLRQYALDPSGQAIEYTESLLGPPVGLLARPLRWPTSECLCRSNRRLLLMRERYGVSG